MASSSEITSLEKKNTDTQIHTLSPSTNLLHIRTTQKRNRKKMMKTQTAHFYFITYYCSGLKTRQKLLKNK